jgi:hypothetical protein
MPKIIAHLDGGLVQSAYGIKDDGPVEFFVIDTDTDECFDDPNLTVARNIDGKKINAYIHQVPLDTLEKGSDLDKLFKKYLKDNK